MGQRYGMGLAALDLHWVARVPVRVSGHGDNPLMRGR